MLEITNKYPEGQRQLRRPRHGWENYIWLGITETGCEGMGLIHLSGLCQHRNKPSSSMKAGGRWPAKQRLASLGGL